MVGNLHLNGTAEQEVTSLFVKDLRTSEQVEIKDVGPIADPAV